MSDNKKIYNILRPRTAGEMYSTNVWIDKIESMTPEQLAASSYLLVGPRGSGKTTLSRIISNKIGSREPMEINAADERRIEDMRSLKEKMNTMPIMDNYLAIIVDEAGEITESAQKMFLKELEDSPPYTCIMFSTTDEHKIIPTIRDRCITIRMRRLEKNDAKSFSDYISRMIQSRILELSSEKENSWIISVLKDMLNVVDPGTIEQLIELTDGSIRGIINGLYSYSITGTLPQKSQVDASVDMIFKYMRENRWNDIYNLLKTIPNQDIPRVHKRIGDIMVKWGIKRIENMELIDRFMDPIEYGAERTVLMARLAVLKNKWV